MVEENSAVQNSVHPRKNSHASGAYRFSPAACPESHSHSQKGKTERKAIMIDETPCRTLTKPAIPPFPQRTSFIGRQTCGGTGCSIAAVYILSIFKITDGRSSAPRSAFFLGSIGSGPKSQNTPVYKKTHATLPAPYRPKPQQNPVVARCTAKRKIFLPFLRFVFWSVNLRCGRWRRQRTHSHRYLCHYRPIFIPIIRATQEAQ